jgi:hypothetical protein
MAMRRATTHHRAGRWRRQLRRMGAGLVGVLLCATYLRAGWLGLAGLALAAVDVGLVWFLVRLDRSGSRGDRDRLTSAQLVAPRRASTPGGSVARHVAFASALVEVAERYRAECERQAHAESAAGARGLPMGGGR